MRRILGGGLLALAAAGAVAQEDTVVVTATRTPQPSLEIPASVDRIFGEEIREGRPHVNLSESLGGVPGIIVQNRNNYAQDLQISSRGFGARATFGVRGIRLIADGIPATMPDGQGQAATFALGSAERIEVLRGPFSSLYGNAAGGVIVVDTADPPATPEIGGELFYGKYDTWRASTRFGAQQGAAGLLGDLSRFESDGYREHSAVRRDHFNLKMKYGWSPDTTLTVIGNQLRQPETQDPLGLTRAQFEDNPRAATPPALAFDTRKSVFQEQLGASLMHRLDAASRLQASVYGGTRWVEQYLAIPLAAQNAPTSSGGVVQLDRAYGGAALRYFRDIGETLRLSAGAEYERMDERRKGFINNFGVATDLKRDEDDTVSSTDFYVQGEWKFAERWSALGGVRSSHVAFRSSDNFIVPGNPDDSGSRNYSAPTPVAGLVFRLNRNSSLYGTFGRGFETPTFAELAHQNPPLTGLNFALEASHSSHLELGAKSIFPDLARVNLALFGIETKNEIVVDTSSGGRTTYRNAGRTERRGFELAGQSLLRGPWSVQLAVTYLDATFQEGFSVPAGNAIPGVPKSQAYAQLAYRRPAFYAYLEGLRRSRVPVNDANSEFADAYNLLNLVGGLVQQGRGWRVTGYVRLDNLADRNYAGSMIVNEANSRFYEPSPRRSMSGGIQASFQFS